MSWPDAQGADAQGAPARGAVHGGPGKGRGERGSRRRFLLALGLVLPLALGGCGFRPIYGKNSADPAIREELASVAVQTINDRQGQLLRNALLARINPLGEPSAPAYSLSVRMTIGESQQALRTDDTATRDQMTYTVQYRLYAKGVVVTAGTLTRTLSFDFLLENYANVSAQSDIDERAANQLAEELQYRLAGYFIKAAESRAEKKP